MSNVHGCSVCCQDIFFIVIDAFVVVVIDAFVVVNLCEGDPRSNANPSVISSTFGISKNGLHVYYDILSIL